MKPMERQMTDDVNAIVAEVEKLEMSRRVERSRGKLLDRVVTQLQPLKLSHSFDS